MAISKAALWAKYTERNPHWLTEGVTLTPAGIKALFDQTFDLGHALGFENGKAIRSASDGAYDAFADIFGTRKAR